MLLHHTFLLRTVNISHHPPAITSSLTYPALNWEVVEVEYDQHSRWHNNSNHPTLYSTSFSKLCLSHIPCNMPTLHYIKHKDLEKTSLNNFLTICNWIWKQTRIQHFNKNSRCHHLSKDSLRKNVQKQEKNIGIKLLISHIYTRRKERLATRDSCIFVPRECHTWKVFQVKVTWNNLQQGSSV